MHIINTISRIALVLAAGLATACSLRAGGTMYFTPNNGQWDTRISYQLEIPGGYMYLEKNGVTCFLLDRPHMHDHEPVPASIKAHAFKMFFEGAQTPAFVNEHKSTYYNNYFLGNNPSKWKSHVYSYETITYKNIYQGIDYRISTHTGVVKSEYAVQPHANVANIKLRYEGADELSTENGKLIVKTSLGRFIEDAPLSWQIINGVKHMVKCSYVVKNNRVHFSIDKSYNPTYELIIDPVLMFASYIGSTADNFGCTATYDDDKNVYSGALVYPSGVYPTTFGAYQINFNGSGPNARDMGISKFNAAGSQLMYSTYLGGSEQEVPHSLVVNSLGELYILGTTSSSNYPVNANAFDASFNGGTPVSAVSQGINFTAGCDIVVTHLDAAGGALMGSTFVGGTGNDGLNYSATLNYNYGDIIRGEIILDALENPVITTTTGSADFPVTAGVFQTTFGGGTDGCIFKLNPALSALTWSGYFGGTGDDASFGVQMDGAGNYFMTGGTVSPNLAVTPGAVDGTHNGGADGFIAKVSPNGNSLLACTYLGTAQYDQSYLVQIDQYDSVYVFGQTLGNYPISPGVYNNPNSGQFLHKLNNALTASGWSTRIGRGAGVVDISPTAFLVNSCDQIYLCGWGGTVNHFQQAISSTTSGMPITPGTFQSTTDGSDFWLAILSPNAGSLVYGTFFGGATSKEHVDGGTSRFDKDGVVYQAVCAGCGGNDDFPTTAGAWSTVNPSPNCNIGVFKFNLDNVFAQANFQFVTNNCQIPATVDFINLSSGAATYEWDFGDGNTSAVAQPQHTYAGPGSYNVRLIASDPNTCNGKDTFYLNIFIPTPLVLSTMPSDSICDGENSQCNVIVTGGGGVASYAWLPAAGLNNPAIANPIANPTQSTLYSVIVTDTNGCVDTQTVYIHVHAKPLATFTPQFTPCEIPVGVNFPNGSNGTTTFTWLFGDGNSGTAINEQHVYTQPGNYTVTLIAHDESGCGMNDTTEFQFFLPPPAVVTATGSDSICQGLHTPVTASGGATYEWIPPVNIDDPNSGNTYVYPTVTTQYTVVGTDTNGCSDTATVMLYVFPPPDIDAGEDLVYDWVTGEQILNANVPPGGSFYWWPSTGLSCTVCENPVATPEFTTTYYLTYTDIYNCVHTDDMTVYVSPSLFIPNAFTHNGDGTNDVWGVAARNLSHFHIRVFNRWGQLIFETSDASQLWDGTYKGKACPEGVYVWHVEYADQVNPGHMHEKRGHVTLIR